jgi:hypothetical protein
MNMFQCSRHHTLPNLYLENKSGLLLNVRSLLFGDETNDDPVNQS